MVWEMQMSFLSELKEDRENSMFKEVSKDTIWLESLQISVLFFSMF